MSEIRLEARVRESYFLPFVNCCGGIEFIKTAWKPIPDGRLGEVQSYSEWLEWREVELVEETIVPAPTAELSLTAGAQEIVDLYGLDVAAVDGPGCLIPNDKGNVTKEIALKAAEALAGSLGATLDALAAAHELEVDLAELVGNGSGPDGLLTDDDVRAAYGLLPDVEA